MQLSHDEMLICFPSQPVPGLVKNLGRTVYIFSRMQVYDIVVLKSKNEQINELWMDKDDILSG